jgi:hypothetical protein
LRGFSERRVPFEVFNVNIVIKKYIDLQINQRETIRCEHNTLGGKLIVRILRLKPDASGNLRAVSCFEVAERHLLGLIAILSELASVLGARQ